MSQIRCLRCGGLVELTADSREAVCRSCGHRFPVPKQYSQMESAFSFAEDARGRRDFTAAADAYTELISQYPQSAAAYWGRALSRYGIEYQPLSGGEYRLVCCKAQLAPFADDADAGRALDLADGTEQAYYMNEMGRITMLQEQVNAYSALHEGCNVLIAADPRQAASVQLAEKLMAVVNAAGKKPFCPAIAMADTPRDQWEPTLYKNFSTASVMIVAAADRQAFTPGLLFDVQRFLTKKAEAQRQAEAQVPLLLVVFDQLSEYRDIPDLLMDHADDRFYAGDGDFMQALADAIGTADAGFGENLNVAAGSRDNYEYTNLLRQARVMLEDGKFEMANELYDQVLNRNYQENQAYWGTLLARERCRNEEALIAKGVDIQTMAEYRSALAFASEREQQVYHSVAERALASMEQQHRKAEQERRQEEALGQQQQQQYAEADRRYNREANSDSFFKKGLLALAAVAVAVTAIVMVVMLTKNHKLENTYKEAQRYYNVDKNFTKAKKIFLELGDYKDSEEMAELCQKQYEEYQEELEQSTYNYAMELMENGDYTGALNALRELDVLWDTDELIEVCESLLSQQVYHELFPDSAAPDSTTLQQMEQEAAAAAEGLLPWERMQVLKKYGPSCPSFMKAWRDCLNHSFMACTAEGLCLYRDKNGDLRDQDGNYYGYSNIRTVSISPDGALGVVILGDGRARTFGPAGDVGLDMRAWEDIIAVRNDNYQAVGLSANGDFWVSDVDREGSGDILTSSVTAIEYQNFDGYFITAVLRDNGDTSAWTNMAQDNHLFAYIVNHDNVRSVAFNNTELNDRSGPPALLVTENDVCIGSGDMDGLGREKVLAVIGGQGNMAIVLKNGDICTSSGLVIEAAYPISVTLTKDTVFYLDVDGNFHAVS